MVSKKMESLAICEESQISDEEAELIKRQDDVVDYEALESVERELSKLSEEEYTELKNEFKKRLDCVLAP